MIVTTSPDAHHDRVHEFVFPDGIIPAGWYQSNTLDGHFHGVHVEEDIAVGDSAELVTDVGYGIEHEGHAHTIVVTAVEARPEVDPDDDGDRMTVNVEPMSHETLRAREGEYEIKRARHGGIREVKQAERNGVPVGIVEAYLSTWDVDTGGVFGVPDQFVRGAWAESLVEHRRRGNRQVRLKDHHGRTVGGFPIDTVREDEVGLFGIGEINLESQAGRELYSLARQRVLTDMSVGYIAIDDDFMGGVRRIRRARLLEASIVDEPANPAARILEVKAVVPFQDLPLASRDRRWDSNAAINRVRRFTDSQESPSRDYRRAFVWYDREDADNFGAYKLPIADVIDGELHAVPRAIFAAAAVLRGGRGGVDIPSEDRPRVIRHLERYYRKLDMESPFRQNERSLYIDVETARASTPAEIEVKLIATGVVSRGAAKVIASRIREAEESKGLVELAAILGDLREAKVRLGY